MASNEIQSTETAENNNTNMINMNSGGSKEELKTVKKAVVAYRPASKAKKSSNRAQLVINKSNKSPEDLQDEVLQLKKSLMTISEENSVLKAKIRRTEEENAKKSEELRRILIDKKSSANTTINNLKQRVIKLELNLKEKEQTLKKLQSDLKASKAKEMKIQLDTCYQEISRLKNLNQKKSASSPPKALKDGADFGERVQNEGPSSVYNTKGDYQSMSKEQLVCIINEMEKKLKNKRPDAMYDSKLYHEKKKLEEKLKQASEELHSYQKLAETRETEVKSLRSTIANLQRSSEKDVALRQSNSSRTNPSTSTDLSATSARGSSAPIRSAKTATSPHDAFTMSSTVRKMSSKGTEVRKTGSSLVSPRTKPEEKAETPRLGGKRSLNKLELDLSKVTPSFDNRRALSARSTIRSGTNKSSISCPNDSEQWVMQATVKRVDKSNRTGESSSGYTVPSKLESKLKAAGDSHRVVDFQVVEEFRQNCAAKKIQKRWKKHQRSVDQMIKLGLIRSNCAARVIQKGWKRHRNVKPQAEKRSVDHDDDDDVIC